MIAAAAAAAVAARCIRAVIPAAVARWKNGVLLPAVTAAAGRRPRSLPPLALDRPRRLRVHRVRLRVGEACVGEHPAVVRREAGRPLVERPRLLHAALPLQVLAKAQPVQVVGRRGLRTLEGWRAAALGGPAGRPFPFMGPRAVAGSLRRRRP